ncbi:hypothetical protein GDO86_002330 [Hymenochirus boettgeri]|uniref:Corticotropin-releasing factor-binding protein n=1 Tax=Hymenochirus boettgeri TaxID=247094 RepID=A0A8T2KMG1_9PIPI|nr:hypothetical protein GDO86_002330 [Hymenochirus boettgeri]
MSLVSRLDCCLLLIFLAVLRGGDSRYIQMREPAEDALILLNSDLKRELSEGQVYRRSLRCIDMLSIEGQFTYQAERPQLNCALFIIGEPEEYITIEYNFVNIDCLGGDILKVFDGWIMKGEKFPSSLDHPLSTTERYTDICEDLNIGTITRSSQNVAMIFFRVQEPGHGFTITIRKIPNLFPCNVISQSKNGRFTMIIPHQHRNCSFSIIYPVVINIFDLTLGHVNELQLKKPPPKGCGDAGDFVELLGGAGLAPSICFNWLISVTHSMVRLR